MWQNANLHKKLYNTECIMQNTVSHNAFYFQCDEMDQN